MQAKQGGAVAHAIKRTQEVDAAKLTRKRTSTALDTNLRMSLVSIKSKSSLDEIEEVDLKEMFESQAKVKQSFDTLATKIIQKKNPSTAYKINGKKNVDFYNANSKTDANKKFLI